MVQVFSLHLYHFVGHSLSSSLGGGIMSYFPQEIIDKCEFELDVSLIIFYLNN